MPAIGARVRLSACEVGDDVCLHGTLIQKRIVNGKCVASLIVDGGAIGVEVKIKDADGVEVEIEGLSPNFREDD